MAVVLSTVYKYYFSLGHFCVTPVRQQDQCYQLCGYCIICYYQNNRARQLYKNISMLFLFPVKDDKLSTGVNATFDASC